MMKLTTRIVKKLERVLEEECTLYTEYLAILAQEQSFVITLKADQVSALSSRRSEIMYRLSLLRDERTEMLELESDGETGRLTELVEQHGVLAEKKRLLNLISRMKHTLHLVEEKSKEFNHVLSFTLGLINGEISLLWSASQSVTRVYDSFGSLHEAQQPSAPRAGSLLGQA